MYSRQPPLSKNVKVVSIENCSGNKCDPHGPHCGWVHSEEFTDRHPGLFPIERAALK